MSNTPPAIPDADPTENVPPKNNTGLVVAVGVAVFALVLLIAGVAVSALSGGEDGESGTTEVAAGAAKTTTTTRPIQTTTTTTLPVTTAPPTTAAPTTAAPTTAPPVTPPPAPAEPRYGNPKQAIEAFISFDPTFAGAPFVGDCQDATNLGLSGLCWLYREGGPGEPPEYSGYVLGFTQSETIGKLDLRSDEFGYWVAGYTPFPPLGER